MYGIVGTNRAYAETYAKLTRSLVSDTGCPVDHFFSLPADADGSGMRTKASWRALHPSRPGLGRRRVTMLRPIARTTVWDLLQEEV